MGGWKSAYVNRWASEERMKKKRDFLKSVYVRMQKLHNATREVRNNYHLRGIAFRRRQVLEWAGNLWISVFLGLLCLTSLRRKALWRNCVFQCYNQYLRDALLACPATKRSLPQGQHCCGTPKEAFQAPELCLLIVCRMLLFRPRNTSSASAQASVQVTTSYWWNDDFNPELLLKLGFLLPSFKIGSWFQCLWSVWS